MTVGNKLGHGLALVGAGAAKVGRGVAHLFAEVDNVDKLYHALTPEAKAAALKTFADVLEFVAVFQAASAEKGTNFVLDENVVAVARKLYTDAALDIQTAKQVFAALSLPLPATLNRPAKAA